MILTLIFSCNWYKPKLPIWTILGHSFYKSKIQSCRTPTNREGFFSLLNHCVLCLKTPVSLVLCSAILGIVCYNLCIYFEFYFLSCLPLSLVTVELISECRKWFGLFPVVEICLNLLIEDQGNLWTILIYIGTLVCLRVGSFDKDLSGTIGVASNSVNLKSLYWMLRHLVYYVCPVHDESDNGYQR